MVSTSWNKLRPFMNALLFILLQTCEYLTLPFIPFHFQPPGVRFPARLSQLLPQNIETNVQAFWKFFRRFQRDTLAEILRVTTASYETGMI